MSLYVAPETTEVHVHDSGPVSTFDRALKAARERRGYTQSDLARLAEIHTSYICRMEAGTRAPSRDTADILADALALTDVERDDFLRAAGFAPRESPEDVQFRALPDATKRALLRLVETVREEGAA